MYERFTDRARKVMQLANQEAQRFNHEYLGTEHILLGLIKEGSGVAANVLKNLDIDLRRVRVEVEKLVQSGPEEVRMGKLPQTPTAKRVVEQAMFEARTLNHNYVGTEHLLLGLTHDENGVAAHVFNTLGVTYITVREEVMCMLGYDEKPTPDVELDQAPSPTPVAARRHVVKVFVRVPIPVTGWFRWFRQPQSVMQLVACHERTAAQSEQRKSLVVPQEDTSVERAWAHANRMAVSSGRSYVCPADVLYGLAVSYDAVVGAVLNYRVLEQEILRTVQRDSDGIIFDRRPKNQAAHQIHAAMIQFAMKEGCEYVHGRHLAAALVANDDACLGGLLRSGRISVSRVQLLDCFEVADRAKALV